MSTLGPEQIIQWKQMLKSMGPPALTIRTSYHLTEPYEDWTRCRSVSRARRRHAKGVRTAMRVVHRPMRKALQINGELWMHPEMERHLKHEIARRADEYAKLVMQHGETAAKLMLLGFGPPEEDGK